jgi:hypothetical protein
MALPGLPSLPSLSESPQLRHPPTLNVQAPSGNGWGFTPDGGWGIDSSGYGPQGDGFFGGGGDGGLFGGGGGIFGGGSGGGGIVISAPPINVGGGGGSGTISVGGTGGTATNAGFNPFSYLPAINWGRIGAFLLGLLLIAGGLYLIKPVQQVVNRTGKNIGKSLIED